MSSSKKATATKVVQIAMPIAEFLGVHIVFSSFIKAKRLIPRQRIDIDGEQGVSSEEDIGGSPCPVRMQVRTELLDGAFLSILGRLKIAFQAEKWPKRVAACFSKPSAVHT